MSIIILLILLLMFITPIISVTAAMLRFAQIKQSASWPQIRGEVTDVHLRQRGKQYQPLLYVSYTVNGQTYSSRQYPVSKTGQAKGSKAWAREFSLRYKPGTAVSLYYDPKQPKKNVLNPQQQPNNSHLQLTSGIMILLSVGLHLLGARGLIANYLNLSGSSVLVAMLITTVVTLLLGAALGLLIQDTRQSKT